MISFIVSTAFGFLAGAICGILIYRNNIAKLQAKESEGKKLLDALKGK